VDSKQLLIKFKRLACKRLCQLCKDGDATFCASMMSGDPDRFCAIIKHIALYRVKHLEVWESLQTFPGFTGLFCNFHVSCPLKDEQCANLEAPIYCYSLFLEQQGRVLNRVDEAKIFEGFSGINISKVKLNAPFYTMPENCLGKKPKKKLLKMAALLLNLLRVEPVKKKQRKENKEKKKVEKKEILTYLFWNDGDTEWTKEIMECLGDEINHKQLDNPAGNPPGNDRLAVASADD
jgi:hypothetical protein